MRPVEKDRRGAHERLDHSIDRPGARMVAGLISRGSDQLVDDKVTDRRLASRVREELKQLDTILLVEGLVERLEQLVVTELHAAHVLVRRDRLPHSGDRRETRGVACHLPRHADALVIDQTRVGRDRCTEIGIISRNLPEILTCAQGDPRGGDPCFDGDLVDHDLFVGLLELDGHAAGPFERIAATARECGKFAPAGLGGRFSALGRWSFLARVMGRGVRFGFRSQRQSGGLGPLLHQAPSGVRFAGGLRRGPWRGRGCARRHRLGHLLGLVLGRAVAGHAHGTGRARRRARRLRHVDELVGDELEARLRGRRVLARREVDRGTVGERPDPVVCQPRLFVERDAGQRDSRCRLQARPGGLGDRHRRRGTELWIGDHIVIVMRRFGSSLRITAILRGGSFALRVVIAGSCATMLLRAVREVAAEQHRKRVTIRCAGWPRGDHGGPSTGRGLAGCCARWPGRGRRYRGGQALGQRALAGSVWGARQAVVASSLVEPRVSSWPALSST